MKIEKGQYPKKYTAYVQDNKTKKIRKISFGDQNYQHYKDEALKIYKSHDHNDETRRRLYFLRHSGVDNKEDALIKEIKNSNKLYNAKILSHKYLW